MEWFFKSKLKTLFICGPALPRTKKNKLLGSSIVKNIIYELDPISPAIWLSLASQSTVGGFALTFYRIFF